MMPAMLLTASGQKWKPKKVELTAAERILKEKYDDTMSRLKAYQKDQKARNRNAKGGAGGQDDDGAGGKSTVNMNDPEAMAIGNIGLGLNIKANQTLNVTQINESFLDKLSGQSIN